MTAQDKTTIKSYFQTGDRPTQAQFEDLIDSYLDTPSAADFGVIVVSAGNPQYIQGVSGQVLTAGTSAAAPSFQTPTTGITELTGDVTASGSGSVAATIANDAVTTGKILNSNVTLAKIANAAASSKLLGSGASGSGAAYEEITLGTGLSMSGTTLNGTAASTAGMEVIATYTPTGVPTVVFSSIPQTYRGLYLVFEGVSNATATRNLVITMSARASDVDSTIFSKKITGTTVSTPSSTDILGTAATIAAAQLFSGYVKILPYQAITNPLTSNATIREVTAFYTSSVETASINGAALTEGVNDIGVSRITLAWNSTGNFDAGTITLYGIL